MSRFAEFIAPVSSERFFADYWERQPLIVDAADSARFGALFSLEEADRILTAGALNFPAIRLARGETRLDPAEFTFASGRIDPLAVAKQFDSGTTIILDQLQETVPALRDLCWDLQSELGFAFHTNIYVTPPNAQGFKVHYDTHDVFILQIAGAKEWETFESPIALPLTGQVHDEEDRVPGKGLVRFRLEPGDLAYVPRGIYHQAVSDRETSVHITLGVVERSWCSFMMEAIAEASLREVELRRALPVGFGLAGFDLAASEREFRRLWAVLGSSIDFQAVAHSFAERLVRGQRGHIEGQLLQMASIGSLTDETLLTARRQTVIVTEGADSSITVEAPSVSVTFPAVARPAVDLFLSGGTVRLRDLPGSLDAASRMVLARRMLREGLIVAVPEQASATVLERSTMSNETATMEVVP